MREILRSIKTKIANSIARAVVQVIDDSKKLQLLQLGVQAGEDVEDCERFQEYGFNSVPLAGAEAVVVFPNGDRSHPLVVAVDDRRHRPTGWNSGDAGLYNNAQCVVWLKQDGTIEISSGGVAVPLATKADIDALRVWAAAHVHVTTATVGATAVPGVLAPPAVVPPSAVGTQKLKAE